MTAGVVLWVSLVACHASLLHRLPPPTETGTAPLVSSRAPAMAHVLAGDLARARGAEAEALEQYRIALRHDPGSAEILARLAGEPALDP